MKRIITPISLLLALTLVATTPAPQPGKGKGQQKKEQAVKGNNDQPGKGNQEKGKSHAAGKQNKANNGQAAKGNKGQPAGNAKNNKPGNQNLGKGNNKGPGLSAPGAAAGKRHLEEKDVYYRWTPETWNTRNQYRNTGKVTICHKLNSSEHPVTIRVSTHALQAHLNHGDAQGECPAYTNNRYGNDYWNRRTDYYNFLGQQYDQVVYSQSVLNYALERLGLARTQLSTMQNGNYPPEEINRRQVVVTELEQNVSVLEQLLGVAANLVVNKLMN